MGDLTQAEQAFFATGELPAELVAQQTPAPAIVPTTQIVAPVTEPAIAPFDTTDLLRRSLEEAQAARVRAETQLEELKRQSETANQPKIQAPDPNLDPLGSMMHQLDQMNKTVVNLEQKLSQEQQNNLLKQQFEQFTNSIREIKQNYEKTVPDFQAAYDHVRAVRTEDLRMVGVPAEQISQVLLQDELNIAQNAIKSGRNPAEEMYKMAKRYGYAPKAAAAMPTLPTEKLANIVKGQQTSKDLPRADIGAELTTEGLRDAGDSDLNKLVQDDKLWAKLVGGTSHDIF